MRAAPTHSHLKYPSRCRKAINDCTKKANIWGFHKNVNMIKKITPQNKPKLPNNSLHLRVKPPMVAEIV